LQITNKRLPLQLEKITPQSEDVLLEVLSLSIFDALLYVTPT